MDDSINIVTGQASLLTLNQVHHESGLVAPIVPRHLVSALTGGAGEYSQQANFPWSSMACYILMMEVEQIPKDLLDHGCMIDYFCSGERNNGYNTCGGIVVCSGGIFLSQQNVLGSMSRSEGHVAGYGKTIEAFNTHLAPLMDRPNRRPSVAVIHSEYRNQLCVFSSDPESWASPISTNEGHEQRWTLPEGWGIVGEMGHDGDVGWLNVVLARDVSPELSAACRFLIATHQSSSDL